MKRSLLFTFFLLKTATAFCQFDVMVTGVQTPDYHSYDSMYIEGKSVGMDRTTFNDVVLNMKVKDPATKKVVREFFRIDNRGYYYIQYNLSEKIIAEGKLEIREKVLQSILLPVYDSLGRQTAKKLLKSMEFHFVKTGFWTESIDEVVSSGNYINNLKDGTWQYAKYQLPGAGVLFKKEYYKSGKLLKTESTEVLSKDEIRTRKILSGQWELDSDRSIYNNDSILMYHKTPVQGYSKHCIRFDSTGNAVSMMRMTDRHLKTGLHRAPHNDAKNRIVYIDADNKKYFTIGFLSDQQLMIILNM